MPAIDFIATNRRADLFRQDPSFRYRCENLALALRDQGWQTRLQHVRELAVPAAGAIVVFHRPALTARLAWLLWRLRRRRIMVVADYDDLVFDPAFAPYSPAVLNGILPLHTMRRRFARSRRALHLFDRITVATQPLQTRLHDLMPGLPVAVVPNAVHHDWLAIPQSTTRQQAPVLTYFPGTRSHDRDFALVTPALESVLRHHPDLQLHITGTLQHRLQASASQLQQHERVGFDDYAAHVQRGSINLAPLEDTPFNRCKSALKVLEAGFHGIPTVCSRTPDNERFRAAGAILVDRPEDWPAAIDRLLTPTEYATATRDLRARVLALAAPSLMAQRFLDACS